MVQQEMWTFLRRKAVNDESEAVVEEVAGEFYGRIDDIYASASDIRVTLINCPYAGIYGQLKSLMRKTDAQVDHYVTADDDCVRTVHAINALMAIFYEKRYSGYLHAISPKRDRAEPNGISRADVMLCEYTDSLGREREDVIVFDSDFHGFAQTRTGRGLFRKLYSLPEREYTVFKRSYFEYDAFENYIQYSVDYAALEYNRPIYKIKPDIGVDYISADILADAVLEGPMSQKDGSFIDTITQLKSIYEKRTEDTYKKHKPSHVIYKQSAMKRFAQTGRTTDHFWGMRPFTKSERISILNQLLRHQKSNPYFHIYFLRDDDAMGDLEIALYEGKGVLILDANTDYDLARGHAEAMITHQEFIRLFKEFYLETLLQHNVTTQVETTRLLIEMIHLCEDSNEA
ncbi:MAG: hypothetical protein Q4D04_09285 [Clostridia bacterium]|nr:hypothetical protein [Clostridia bacterium]